MRVPNFIYFGHKKLVEDIGTILPDAAYPYFSEGLWSHHELFLYLLGITGPAEVWISTFSISEISIRSFASAIEENLITKMHCIFDHTVKKNKMELLYFANNIVLDAYLVANHAKLILIKNDKWQISVIGSANMTPNPRKEVGVIFTIPSIFEKYLGYFEQSKASGIKVSFDEDMD